MHGCSPVGIDGIDDCAAAGAAEAATMPVASSRAAAERTELRVTGVPPVLLW